MKQNFDWVDLPDPTKRGFSILATESDRDVDIPDYLTTPTTFAACPDWITREAKVISPLDAYLLIHAEKAGTLQRRFIFAPPLTRESAQTPFRSYYETEPSMFWPKVLLSLKAYRRAETDAYIIRPRYKEAYQGPTRVLIEEFYSPTPFEIPLYEPMVDRGLNEEIGFEYYDGVDGPYWLSVGSLNLDSCLHPAISITVPLNPVIAIGIVTYTTASLSDTATNYTDWPDTLVIDDRQREVLGGWARRRVTALRPMIVRVTLPTSASITSTGATLGGTVAIEDNAVVESRGVVYALTAQDANPEVGNSLATSAATTGTTGTYTQAVTGLTPSSNYSFKPWALTSQGVRVYGPVGTFTTSAP
jgi:hypothetical protein